MILVIAIGANTMGTIIKLVVLVITAGITTDIRIGMLSGIVISIIIVIIALAAVFITIVVIGRVVIVIVGALFSQGLQIKIKLWHDCFKRTSTTAGRRGYSFLSHFYTRTFLGNAFWAEGVFLVGRREFA